MPWPLCAAVARAGTEAAAEIVAVRVHPLMRLRLDTKAASTPSLDFQRRLRAPRRSPPDAAWRTPSGPIGEYHGLKECSFEGFERPAMLKGLCQTHRDYLRHDREQKPIAVRRMIKPCEFGGDAPPAEANGLCATHYAQRKASNELKPLRLHRRRKQPSTGKT